MTDIPYHGTRFVDRATPPFAARSASVWPWVILGIGLGALLNGILFHQILQWHTLLSNTVPPSNTRSI